MADQLEVFLEAERRGLLDPETTAILNEARKRGLIPTGEKQTPEPAQDGGFLNAAKGFGDRVSDMASFGFADELRAGGSALGSTIRKTVTGQESDFSADYDKFRQEGKQQSDQFQAQYPKASVAADVSGLLMPGAGAKVGAGGLLKSMARAAPVGVVGGTASGFGNAEGGAGERADEALTGGLIGGGLAASIPLLGAGAGKVGGFAADLFRKPGDKAMRRVAKSLGADGENISGVRGALSNDGVVADAGGKNTRALADAVANRPGRAMDVAGDLVDRRSAKRPSVLLSATKDALGTKFDKLPVTPEVAKEIADKSQFGGFYGMVDALKIARSAAAKPLYQAAYKGTVPITPKLRALFSSKASDLKSAWASARRVIANESGEDIQSYEDVRKMFLSSNPVEVKTQVIDIAKRGLDELIEKSRDAVTGKLPTTPSVQSLQNLRSSLIAAGDMNPAYREARRVYAGPSQAIDAMENGRAFLKLKDEETVARQFSRLSENDKDFYRMGVQRAIEDLVIGPANNGYDVSRYIKRIQHKLKPIFGEKHAAFMETLQREASRAKSEKAWTGGSPTSLRQEMQAELDGKYDSSIINDMMLAVNGNPMGLVGRVGSGAYNRMKSGPQKVSDEIGDVMFNKPTPDQLKLLEEAMNAALMRGGAGRGALQTGAGGAGILGGLLAQEF